MNECDAWQATRRRRVAQRSTAQHRARDAAHARHTPQCTHERSVLCTVVPLLSRGPVLLSRLASLPHGGSSLRLTAPGGSLPSWCVCDGRGRFLCGTCAVACTFGCFSLGRGQRGRFFLDGRRGHVSAGHVAGALSRRSRSRTLLWPVAPVRPWSAIRVPTSIACWFRLRSRRTRTSRRMARLMMDTSISLGHRIFLPFRFGETLEADHGESAQEDSRAAHDRCRNLCKCCQFSHDGLNRGGVPSGNGPWISCVRCERACPDRR